MLLEVLENYERECILRGNLDYSVDTALLFCETIAKTAALYADTYWDSEPLLPTMTPLFSYIQEVISETQNPELCATYLRLIYALNWMYWPEAYADTAIIQPYLEKLTKEERREVFQDVVKLMSHYHSEDMYSLLLDQVFDLLGS